jgi:hypothetical protein
MEFHKDRNLRVKRIPEQERTKMKQKIFEKIMMENFCI